MKRRRRLSGRKRPSRWTAQDWQRAWDLALNRIDGAPDLVANEPAFQEALQILNEAFADGHGPGFELGLLALLDCCAEAVNRGACEQWW